MEGMSECFDREEDEEIRETKKKNKNKRRVPWERRKEALEHGWGAEKRKRMMCRENN